MRDDKEKKSTKVKGTSTTKKNNLSTSKKSTNKTVKKSVKKDIDLDKTNSYDIVIDSDRLKDKESLDFSFIDGKKKKKKVQKEIEILDEVVDYKEEVKNLEFPKKEKSGKGEPISTILVILFSFILGFLICFIWARESNAFIKIVEKKKIVEKIVRDDNFVFVGDSIFEGYDLGQYYENMPVVNSGISGHKTSDILNDMNNRIYRYNPSKVIILIGTNDYSSITVDDTVKNIEKIIDGIKSNRPYAEIYVQSVYPVNSNINEGVTVDERNNKDINTINDGIKKICADKKVTYMNIFKMLADEEGNLNEDYTYDGLHLNKNGYKVVTAETMKLLKKAS